MENHAAGRASVASRVLARPRLLRLLRDVTDRYGLTVLTAPAGAGKTVLLDQWIAATTGPRAPAGPPIALVLGRRLGPRPGDAGDLGGALGRAVSRALADRPQDRRRFLADLAAAARTAPDPLAALAAVLEPVGPLHVVIDDLDHLSAAAVADLARLLDLVPEDVHVVVAGRTLPAVPLGRRLAAGTVAFVDHTHLRLLDDEPAALVAALGLDRPADLVAALAARSDGWIAPFVLLATATPRGTGSSAGPGAALPNRVLTYLEEEVLAPLTADDRDLLGSVLALGEVDGPALDAVTGRDDGQHRLERLARRTGLLLPLDDHRTAWRLHPLVAAAVDHVGRRDRPADHRAARVAAARHRLATGHPAAGIDGLVDAGLDAEAAAAIVTHFFALLVAEQHQQIVAWIDRLPSDVLVSTPFALITAGLAHRMNGREDRARSVWAGLDVAHNAVPTATPTPSPAGAVMVATGMAWGSPPADVIAAATLAIEQFRPLVEGPGFSLVSPSGPGAEPAWTLPWYLDPLTVTVFLRSAGAQALLHLGDRAGARSWRQAGRTAAGLDPMRAAVVDGVQAYADARAGDLTAAEAAARRSLDVLGPVGPYAVTVSADLTLAEVACARGSLVEADGHAAIVVRRAASLGAATRVAQAAAVEATIALGRGALRRGLAVVAAYRQAGWAPPPRDVDRRLAAVETVLLVKAGRTDLAARTLERYGLARADAPAAYGALAAATGDLTGLRVVVDGWPAGETRRDRALYLTVRAAFAHGRGDGVDRARCVEELAATVVAERLIQPLHDVVPDLSAVVATVAEAGAGPEVDALLRLLRSVDGPSRRADVRLSPRELAVLEGLADHLDDAEIAVALGVSANTRKTFQRRLYRKLGVSSRREAVRRAEELGILRLRGTGPLR